MYLRHEVAELLSNEAMRIGDKYNSLSIEKIEPAEPHSGWRFEAAAAGAGWKFAAVHDTVTVRCSDDALKQAVDFAILQSPQIEVLLSEGGWLRIKRDLRGYIVVRYRLGRLTLGAAVEGEVILDIKAGDAFCKEFSQLLLPQYSNGSLMPTGPASSKAA